MLSMIDAETRKRWIRLAVGAGLLLAAFLGLISYIKLLNRPPEVIVTHAYEQPAELSEGAEPLPPEPLTAASSPLEEEDSPQPAQEFSNQDKININTATAAELEELKGIGPAKALSIIEYRREYGGFTHPEEITCVKGIGAATYEKIKELICI